MKAQSIPVFAALAVASPLNAATLTWSGSSSGAWNAGTAANWNGVAAVFDNTADAVFDGNTPISTYGTWLGDGNRVVRSLSFSNFATQLEIRLNNNSTTARQLQLASGTGTATIQMASTATAPVIIGALAGTNDNGTVRLDSDLSVVQDSASPLTIRRPVSESGGAHGITKSGSGTLVISAANTYTGNVSVQGGTLQVANNTALGTGPKSVTVSPGATLELSSALNLGATYTMTVSGSGVGGAGAMNCVAGNNTAAQAPSSGLILAGDTTVNGAAGTRYGVGLTLAVGNTTGLFTLTKIGAGQFDVRGNVAIGNVVVNQGVFQTQSSNWNDGGYTLSVAPGAEFRVFDIANPFPRDILLKEATINCTGTADFAGDTLSGDVALTGACTLSSTAGANDRIILSGNLTEAAPGASVTISGSSRVVIAGTTSYTGATTVGSGTNTPTLQADGSFVSNITVADLATLDGEGVTTGTVTLGALSNLKFNPATTGSAQFLRAADFIIGAADQIAVSPSALSNGSQAVVIRDGNGGLNLANFVLINPGRANLALGGAGGNSDLLYNPNSASLEWRAFTDGIWGNQDTRLNFRNTATTLADDFYSNDNVSFNNVATGTVTLGSSIQAGMVTFNNTAGNDVAILPSVAETLTAAGFSTTSSGNVTIAAAITGVTPITVGGTGSLVLTGANTSAAPIQVNSGTLRIGAGGVTGSIASPVVNQSAVVIDRSDALTIGTVISGSGTLTQAGTGTTTLNAANTCTGLTTISSGTLQIEANGSIAGNVLNNSILTFTGGTAKTYAGTISGGGSVVKNGTHLLTLSGSNSFGGGVSISNGTLIAGDANIGSGPITLAASTTAATLQLTGGVVDNDIVFQDDSTGNKVINLAAGVTDLELSGTMTFADNAATLGNARIGPLSGTIVISGKMTGAGTGGFAKRNAGTVVITGTTNDYAGPTSIVDAGTLMVNGNVPGNLNFGELFDGTAASGGNGVLAGSGVIGGNVITRGGSNFSPGGISSAGVNTPTAATLTIKGNLDLSVPANGTGMLFIDLNAPGGTNDLIAVDGTVSIGTGVFGLNDLALNNLGGLAVGTYTLVSTPNQVAGTVDPANSLGTITPGLNGEVKISNDGTDIQLVVTTAGNAFDNWASSFGLTGPDAAFEFDFDKDGFANGLEWILGGNPMTSAAGNLMTTTAGAGGGLTLAFNREEDSIGVATLTVEYGTTLASWPGSVPVGASSSGPDANGVVVTVNAVPDPDAVTVNIPASNAAGGKLFARLKATMP